MEITFHEALGFFMLIFIFLYIARILFRLKTEGFESILSTIPTGKTFPAFCAVNETMIYQLITLGTQAAGATAATPDIFKYGCYSEGVTNVDSANGTFSNDNVYIYFSTPRDYIVKVFTDKDATGTPKIIVSSANSKSNDVCGTDRYCYGDTSTTANLKFKSIKIMKKTDYDKELNKGTEDDYDEKQKRLRRKLRRRMRRNTSMSKSCPSLSPSAAAAAAAAEAADKANAKKIAEIALVTSKAVSQSLTQSPAASGLQITCPTGGDPVINDNSIRNTRFGTSSTSSSMNNYIFNPETES